MSLSKRPESRFWQYRFEVDGKEYRGSTRKEDYAAALRVEVSVRQKVVGAAGLLPAVTLAQIGVLWLAGAGSQSSDARNNRSRVNKLFGFITLDGARTRSRYGIEDGKLAHEVEAADLDRLIAARLAEGNTPATINRELSLIGTLLRVAGAHAFRSNTALDVPRFKLPEAKYGRAPDKTLSVARDARVAARNGRSLDAQSRRTCADAA